MALKGFLGGRRCLALLLISFGFGKRCVGQQLAKGAVTRSCHAETNVVGLCDGQKVQPIYGPLIG